MGSNCHALMDGVTCALQPFVFDRASGIFAQA
jgi:hypothetical protein